MRVLPTLVTTTSFSIMIGKTHSVRFYFFINIERCMAPVPDFQYPGLFGASFFLLPAGISHAASTSTVSSANAS